MIIISDKNHKIREFTKDNKCKKTILGIDQLELNQKRGKKS